MQIASVAQILDTSFYARPALAVARDLLGKELIRRVSGKTISGTITEVEAYIGQQDKACHAHKGLTKRTSVMFGPPGYWYVYFVYGMYWMLNIVTGRERYPAAVLIRGMGEWNGPGKLTREMGIDGKLNGCIANKKTGLWIEDSGVKVPRSSIIRTPRIGVDYAGEWADKPYRFVLIENGKR